MQHVPYRLAPLPAYIRTRTVSDGTRRYDVIYRRGGRYTPVERAGTFRTKREAELRRRTVADWIAGAKDPKLELVLAREPGLTVEQSAREWLAGKRRINADTREEYGRRVERVSSWFAGVTVEALTARDVGAWIDSMGHLMPGTVGGYVTTFRSILDSTGMANVARDRRIELPRRARRIVQPPDAQATYEVLSRVNRRHRQVCVLIEQTGLRVGEAVGVRPEHLDPVDRRLLVPVTKTRVPRWVPIAPWLLDVLEPPFGVNRRGVYHALAAACDLAGVPRFGPHMLRHRRASLWHLRGVPPVEAAAWLGHSPHIHLGTYAHVMRIGEIEAHRLAALL